ncbi:darcynin family protein [Leisingera sp.]|uniref:darcynin family protein n=1 Tax=Leisingera sp. TaxID=1879318 RepID=UPI002B26942A|nr:darcynin family protein [Leisingera sp.]
MKLTVFLLLRAAPSWLRLDRAERGRIADAALEPFTRDGLTLRHFDAEAFHGRISDVAMIEADDATAYYFAMEQLRDSPLIAEGYFETLEIIPAYENGFRHFEAAHAV